MRSYFLLIQSSALIRLVLISLLILTATDIVPPPSAHAAQQTDIFGPGGSGAFGSKVIVLPNGNFIVADPGYDEGAIADVGAISLYSGATLELISMLKGSTANDKVGNDTILVLTNGNFVMASPSWDNATIVADWQLWEQVQERLARMRPQQLPAPDVRQPLMETAEAARSGETFLTRARLGQGSFRLVVTEAYTRRCAMTGEKTLLVLRAAHIKPYAESGPHSTRNGLLLRSDLHILFDCGSITVNTDLTIEVSRSIKEQFSNGREYYALHSKPLAIIPSASADRPASEFLQWHNSAVYKG